MKKITFLLPLLVILSCSDKIDFTESAEFPSIFPDYVGVTVPEGIADLNFRMSDGRSCIVARTVCEDTVWYSVKAYGKGAKSGISYTPFPVYISHDPIDPYIAYRLIEPGYESWDEMGIFQRELSSYKETDIVTNEATEKGCMNCHTFQNGNQDRMLFHARGTGGGTIFINGDEIELLNLATIGPLKQGTYPTWHPDGRFVAFSSNSTNQCFTQDDSQPIEVYDTSSDIILYDTETKEVTTHPSLSTEDVWETFPSWSSDGKTLYYCAADAVEGMPEKRAEVHYRLMAINFDGNAFSGEPRTLFDCDTLSVSFPRVNGNRILITTSAYGTFPIWHKEADLQMFNLESGELEKVDILCSDDTESYHSWSSNGRWLIFSSRRVDGRYTRLFIAHYDGNGNFGKPFMLPQKDADFDELRLKSYNIPEFVKGAPSNRNDVIEKLFKK